MGTWHHLLFAFRGLFKAKGFVATVVFTLSVTVGALLMVIAMNSAVFFQPLPYPFEERLVVANQVSSFDDYETRNAQSTNSLNLWYQNQSAFEAFTTVYNAEVFLEDARGQPLLPASYVLPEYFDIFGVDIIKGRAFTEQDEGLDASNDNIIISEKVWQSYFDSSDSIVGSTVSMFGRPWRIVGVVSSDFQEPNFLGGAEVGIWMPWNMVAGQSSWAITYNNRRAVGLLKPGLTAADGERDLTDQLQYVKDEWVGEWELVRDLEAEVLPLRDVELGNLRLMSVFLLIGTFALLAIAIINTGNLFFTRVIEKNRNLAVHAVLGAKRRDLFMNQLMESLIVCMIAVFLGVVLAAGMLNILPYISRGQLPLLEEISIDWIVLISALVLAFGIALIFSFITSRLLDLHNLKESIQSSGKGSAKSVSQGKLQLLVCSQIMMATFVILGATLFLAKAMSVKGHDLGANIERLYNFHAFAGVEPIDPDRQENLEVEIMRTLSANPDIEGVSSSRIGPFRKDQFTMELRTVHNQSLGFFPANWVDENYLQVSDIELVSGRNFTSETGRVGPDEIMVSRAIAAKLGGDNEALGRTLKDFEDNSYQVVGVVADGYHPTFFDEDKGARVYFFKNLFGFPITLRVSPEASFDQDTANGILKEIDSSLFVYEFHDLELEYQQVVHRETILVIFIGGLVFLTFVLCGVGIFGVLSYNINLRRYDIGIRMAVGAKRRNIYINSIANIGSAFISGLILACGLIILVVWLLFDKINEFILISPFGLIVTLLMIISGGLLAIILPIWKLLSSNPLVALKAE